MSVPAYTVLLQFCTVNFTYRNSLAIYATLWIFNFLGVRDEPSRRLAEIYWNFLGSCSLHLQGRWSHNGKTMQRVSKGKTVTDFGKTNRWQGIRSWRWGGGEGGGLLQFCFWQNTDGTQGKFRKWACALGLTFFWFFGFSCTHIRALPAPFHSSIWKMPISYWL